MGRRVRNLWCKAWVLSLPHPCTNITLPYLKFYTVGIHSRCFSEWEKSMVRWLVFPIKVKTIHTTRSLRKEEIMVRKPLSVGTQTSDNGWMVPVSWTTPPSLATMKSLIWFPMSQEWRTSNKGTSLGSIDFVAHKFGTLFGFGKETTFIWFIW